MSKKNCKNCLITTTLISTANVSLTIGLQQQQSRRLTSNNNYNNNQRFINQLTSLNNLPLRISTSTSNPSSTKRSLLGTDDKNEVDVLFKKKPSS